jgi:hypothetical protein
MADIKHIIEPENLGLWTAVAFIIALLALVVAIVGVNRNSDLTTITQGEVLLLNKKIDGAKPVEPIAPAVPAASVAVPAQPAQQEQK